jgi:hypothetical protein
MNSCGPVPPGRESRAGGVGSSSTMLRASTHDGSIAIGVTLKTFTPLRDRLGDRQEHGVGVFDRLTVVADDAPAPVRVTGGRDSKHVHLDDLDAQTNSGTRNVAGSSQMPEGPTPAASVGGPMGGTARIILPPGPDTGQIGVIFGSAVNAAAVQPASASRLVASRPEVQARVCRTRGERQQDHPKNWTSEPGRHSWVPGIDRTRRR